MPPEWSTARSWPSTGAGPHSDRERSLSRWSFRSGPRSSSWVPGSPVWRRRGSCIVPVVMSSFWRRQMVWAAVSHRSRRRLPVRPRLPGGATVIRSSRRDWTCRRCSCGLGAGRLVWDGTRMQMVGDPIRRPGTLLRTGVARVGSTADKVRCSGCAPAPLDMAPDLLRQPDVPTLRRPRSSGFQRPHDRPVLRPFVGGTSSIRRSRPAGGCRRDPQEPLCRRCRYRRQG